AVRVRVIDVEEPRRLVLRIEGEREQPLLTAAHDLVFHVEERLWEQLAVLHHADEARLLDDVEPVGLARRGSDPERRVESVRNQPELNAPTAGGRRGLRLRGLRPDRRLRLAARLPR